MGDFSEPLPDVPRPKSRRFQLSLGTLLLLVLVCGLGANALRCSGLPGEVQLAGFGVGGIFLAYLTWRWAAAWQRFERWNEVQQHRAELENWTRERRKQLNQQAESSDAMPPEA